MRSKSPCISQAFNHENVSTGFLLLVASIKYDTRRRLIFGPPQYFLRVWIIRNNKADIRYDF